MCLKKINLNIWLARLIFCTCIILIYYTIGNFGLILTYIAGLVKMLTPIIIGGIIAFLFYPISRKIEVLLLKTKLVFICQRVRLFSTLCVALFLLFIVLALFYVILKVVPLIYDGLFKVVIGFSEQFDKICEDYKEQFKDIEVVGQLIDTINSYISSENLVKWISMLNYNSYVGKIASFIGYVSNFFIGIIFSVYVLLERAILKKTFYRILNLNFSRRNVFQIKRAIIRISQILYAFIFGQIVDVFLISYIMGIAFSFLKIPNGLGLAAIYFLFALIPYFGSSIGVFLVTFLSYVLGNSSQFFVVLIVTLILQQVDANLINPKIVGKAVGLGPFNVILGIMLFGGMFGLVGFFLGTPLMAICLELADDVCRAIEVKKNKKT